MLNWPASYVLLCSKKGLYVIGLFFIQKTKGSDNPSHLQKRQIRADTLIIATGWQRPSVLKILIAPLPAVP